MNPDVTTPYINDPEFGQLMYEQGRRDAIIHLLGELENHAIICAIKPSPLSFFCKATGLAARFFPDAIGKPVEGWFFIAQPHSPAPSTPTPDPTTPETPVTPT